MNDKQKILLESGTNELEVVEFFIDYKETDGTVYSSCYGVNVGKVREIIKVPEKITKVAKSHPAMEGIINFRGRIMPIINLGKWLGKVNRDISLTKIIITEFNKAYSGFLVTSVSRIHRISWKNIEPPAMVATSEEDDCITGVVKFEDRIMMMLDFEKVFGDINPSSDMSPDIVPVSEKDRGKTILIAEDSGVVRNLLKKAVKNAGYKLILTNDGEEAYQKLKGIEKKVVSEKGALQDYIHLLITDVEMPRMDGLHLLKKIKENKNLAGLPVILFSSMATKENIKKWENLKANDYISKPELSLLMEKIQKNIL